MISKEQTKGVRTWIEIDTEAIKNNIAEFRAYIGPKVKLMGVVKSNAYGHGLFDVARKVEEYGADWLAVDSISEGLRLRKEGITSPILVLGYTLPEKIPEAIENTLSIGVSHLSTFEAIEKMEVLEKIKVHIKVDTGMHRQGFIESDQDALFAKLALLKDKIIIEGLFTHFSSAKDPNAPEYTQSQITRFESWRKLFSDAGYSPIVHASATGGTILFPEAHYDMVRIGIGLYGLWPSAEIKKSYADKINLKPILSWKTIVCEMKMLPKGSGIGYDGTEVLTRDSVVAVCPIGYWHGYPRALSSVGLVLVKGKKVKILGRVAMDMIVVDLSDCGPVSIGDEVVLIGRQGNEEMSAEDLAGLIDASWYELVTRINPLIRKIHF